MSAIFEQIALTEGVTCSHIDPQARSSYIPVTDRLPRALKILSRILWQADS